MHSRHLAALALVGWYLMMPPWKPTLYANASLSKWAPPWGISLTLTEKFKDSAECEATISRLKHLVKSRPDYVPHDGLFYPSEENFAVMLEHSTCIAEDDPRLRGNIRYTGN